MANISNSTLLDIIDQMAAVSKSQAESYTTTVDLFDYVTREHNPADIDNGAAAADAADIALDAGTSLYAQWSSMQTWLSTRATAAGSTSVVGLIGDRYLRVPQSYDSYIYYPSSGSHVTAGLVFPDGDESWGTLVDATSSWTAASGAMPSNCSYAAFCVECTTTGSGTYSIAMAVEYSDATTATETTTATGMLKNVAELIGYNMASGLCSLGTATVTMGVTAGMVAGQHVLLIDKTYPTKMIADTPLSQPYAYFTPAQIGWYDTGDAVYLKKVGGTDRSYTIEDIDYREGKIKFTSNIATDAYVVADAAFMRLQSEKGDGWNEVHAIASAGVTANTSLLLTGNLQHTYYTAAKVVRLMKEITLATASGGGTGVYDVRTYSERAIAQV
jgi:hypothetical protein